MREVAIGRSRAVAASVLVALAACGRLGFEPLARSDAGGEEPDAAPDGSDDLGQHGDGSELGGTGASEVLLPEPAVDLVSAQLHSCAIGASGAVYCWGSNVAGQVTGAAASELEATPQEIALARPAVALGAHELASCATLDDGELVCWGEFAGQVGMLRWERP